ncbi:large conductance mechanosensitive channel protein MscL [Wenyingzhuangia aestuarii]|uniref:large conductance mechanosensitive channel protein MscL n=1 Tax=Wenyingzhuangia aestuarii TaxID=1647582 RepID=UPI00143C6EB3|nr:large conductance mechanosensitive channel protein MscL [Wenyingzhuangia aestuarii]NJB81471.1 large conductance mechanosensitive channel [Wenyingzhuangia aestuarii]
MLKDFKAFLMKGDIVALATAVIIGGAFKAIVSSLVKDVIMPIVGLLMGGKNVNDLFFVLGTGEYETFKAAQEAGAAVMTYGNFVQAIIDFIIIGFVIFMIVKAYEKTKKKEVPAPAAPKGPSQEELLAEIRDLLAKK